MDKKILPLVISTDGTSIFLRPVDENVDPYVEMVAKMLNGSWGYAPFSSITGVYANGESVTWRLVDEP